jgi:hypothetical protein
MSNYTKSTNFTAKDTLLAGDPNKIIKGLDFDTEFDALQTAVNSKADAANALLTGTTQTNNLTVTGTFTGTLNGGTY